MSSIADLLLASRLAPEDVVGLLRPYAFADPLRADAELQALAADPEARRLLAALLPDVLEAAGASADPDGALSRFERFVRAGGAAARTFSHLRADPRMTGVLLRALGASPFLAEVLIRHPGWMYWLSEEGVLARPRTAEDVAGDVRQELDSLRTLEHRRAALRRARRREALHAGVRDLLGFAPVEETLVALSDAADALIGAALDTVRESLPHSPAAGGFVVLGLGKLGGRELNYSSDVDLVYVYEDSAPGDVEETLARGLTQALDDVDAEGRVYRVDLRLRPEGGAGRVAIAAAAFVEYYATRGATWERLALLKARPVAGDLDLGWRCLEQIAPFVFGRPFGEGQLADVRAIKQAIDRRIAARAETGRHVKLGRGGIREVELVAQVLQLRQGASGTRTRGTCETLDALQSAGALPEADHGALRQAYAFLRDVENKLQMATDAQTHVLPRDLAEQRRLALRLGLRDGATSAQDALRDEYARHTDAVHAVFARVVG
jgi:glutamate-ammonia-ligase adenylyltransferase